MTSPRPHAPDDAHHGGQKEISEPTSTLEINPDHKIIRMLLATAAARR